MLNIVVGTCILYVQEVTMVKQQFRYKGFVISYFDGQYHLTIRDVKSGKSKTYQRPEIHSLITIIDNIRRFETPPPSEPETKRGRFWTTQLK